MTNGPEIQAENYLILFHTFFFSRLHIEVSSKIKTEYFWLDLFFFLFPISCYIKFRWWVFPLPFNFSMQNWYWKRMSCYSTAFILAWRLVWALLPCLTLVGKQSESPLRMLGEWVPSFDFLALLQFHHRTMGMAWLWAWGDLQAVNRRNSRKSDPHHREDQEPIYALGRWSGHGGVLCPCESGSGTLAVTLSGFIFNLK